LPDQTAWNIDFGIGGMNQGTYPAQGINRTFKHAKYLPGGAETRTRNNISLEKYV
jgi:hypothetical protein